MTPKERAKAMMSGAGRDCHPKFQEHLEREFELAISAEREVAVKLQALLAEWVLRVPASATTQIKDLRERTIRMLPEGL